MTDPTASAGAPAMPVPAFGYTTGVCDRTCEKPEGWDELAAANWRPLREDTKPTTKG